MEESLKLPEKIKAYSFSIAEKRMGNFRIFGRRFLGLGSPGNKK